MKRAVAEIGWEEAWRAEVLERVTWREKEWRTSKLQAERTGKNSKRVVGEGGRLMVWRAGRPCRARRG